MDPNYTVAATPKDGRPAMADNAYVQLIGGGNGQPALAARYDVVAKDCAVTIRKQGSEGSLDCPDIQDSAGRSVSLQFTWKARGPRVDRLTTTTSSPGVVSPPSSTPAS